MTPREEELQAENAYLKEQVEQLTNVAAVPALRAAFRIEPQEAKLLLVLTRRANFVVSKDSVYRAVFERENGDGPTNKIMDVVLCGLRKRLVQAGAPGKIVTVRAEGWRSTPDLTAWVRAIINPEREMAA